MKLRLAYASVLVVAVLGPSDGATAKSHKAYVSPPDTHFDFPLDDRSAACGPGTPCDLDAFMSRDPICALVVLKNGKLVMDGFNSGRCPDDDGKLEKDRWKKLYGVASVAKSITSTLLGAAIADATGADTREKFEAELRRVVTADKRLPELKGGYGEIPVDLVLRMRSGIGWIEDSKKPEDDTCQQNTDTCKMDRDVKDKDNENRKTFLEFGKTYRQASRTSRGSFNYKALDSVVLGLVAESYLADAERLPKYFERRLWKELGAEFQAVWNIDIGGSPYASCCLDMTVGDLARFGQMVLERGVNMKKVRIMPAAWFDIATSRAKTVDDTVPRGDSPRCRTLNYQRLSYRHQWWLFPGRNDFTAWGRGGQFIHIYPDEKVVIVQTSHWPRDSREEPACRTFAQHDAIVKALRR